MDKKVGISTDGAAHMVGKVSGALKRIQKVAGQKIYRAWCDEQQLDLSVQAGFNEHVK